MSMLYVLIPLAIGLLALAVWALLWAIKSGQFDDLESHGWSVVLDDDQKPPPLDDEVSVSTPEQSDALTESAKSGRKNDTEVADSTDNHATASIRKRRDT